MNNIKIYKSNALVGELNKDNQFYLGFDDNKNQAVFHNNFYDLTNSKNRKIATIKIDKDLSKEDLIFLLARNFHKELGIGAQDSISFDTKKNRININKRTSNQASMMGKKDDNDLGYNNGI